MSKNELETLIYLETISREFGLDWPDTETIFNQTISECEEIKEAIALNEPKERIQEEIGDLIHSTISLCLFLGYDVNETLGKINKKFGARVQAVKEISLKRGHSTLSGESFEYMMEIWKEAKKLTDL